MDELAPELDIPEAGRYLWDWFGQISKGVRRISEGHCNPITWTDFLSWASVMGLLVHPLEYDILHAMDVAFRNEVDLELDDYRAREQDRSRNQ